jgi:hypothetical protein
VVAAEAGFAESRTMALAAASANPDLTALPMTTELVMVVIPLRVGQMADSLTVCECLPSVMGMTVRSEVGQMT